MKTDSDGNKLTASQKLAYWAAQNVPVWKCKCWTCKRNRAMVKIGRAALKEMDKK
jgi:hypothetical protein